MTSSLCLAPQFSNSKKINCLKSSGANTNHYKLLIVWASKANEKKINIFKYLKMDKIPATTQIFLAQIMKFPDFLDI